LNNPLRYTDPTGHTTCDADGYCGYHPSADSVAASFGVKFTNEGIAWTTAEKLATLEAVVAVAQRLGASSGDTAINTFKGIYGAVHFQMGGCGDDCKSKDKNGKAYGKEGGAFSSGWQSNHGDGYFLIKIATMEDNGGFRGILQMIHELGHTYDYAVELNTGSRRSAAMPDNIANRDSLRPNGYWYNGKFTEQDDVLLWQMHPLSMGNGDSRSEIFADIFVAWTLNAWNTDPKFAGAVQAAQDWMP